MADLLDMEKINSLPHPLWDGEWPIIDIDVETGLYRIDVVGMPEVRHFGELITLRDECGVEHDTDDFYLSSDNGQAEVLYEFTHGSYVMPTALNLAMCKRAKELRRQAEVSV